MECLICDTNCKDCVDNATKCISCEDGFFLDSDVCYPCSVHCLTCETTLDNCLTCNTDV